ncbi:MAG: iron ABC transporter permease [Oscillospiraceae bacterium]|nr:iron ABC transporter permease [Bacteroidaceae bacterium]MBQ5867686.1 iron ABC transporter permease [Oscillospiraceae bacterium]
MATRQSAALDRKKLLADPIMVTTIVVLITFLTLFILYPLAVLLVDSVYGKETGLTMDIFKRIFAMKSFRTAITNTLKVGFAVGIFSTILGLLFAYVEVYVKVHSKFMGGLFQVVSMLPVVSPPFVLSLSMIMLFGKAGIITRYLLKIYDNSVYGFWGITIVQTLTFFPVCYMMLKGLLKNIDPSLEEAARDMGASRFRVFADVTWPLILPGLGNAFLVTFIESIADFANPMIIGGSYDTLATTIYLQITGAYDKEGAAAMAVVLLTITLAMYLVQKYILEAKTAATLTGKASRARMLIEDKSVTVPLTIVCSLIALFVIMMYICVPFGALFNTWGYDFSLTTKWFVRVFEKYKGFKAFRDSFLLSLASAPITALLSMIISYLVVKRKFKAKGFIEFVSMLAMAVPGTVLGIGYIRGFVNGVFGTGFLSGIYGSAAILIIVFVVRSLPTGTRSGISALRQIDKSIEESAYDMGADSFRVFMTVTLPLIKDSFLSGLVTAFVRSITAISAIILLVTPQFLLITVQINEFAEKGSYGIACAFATILIVITYGSVLLMNLFIKYFGTSRKLKEVD